MSELLHQFLSAYIAWVDEGAPHGDPFYRNRGLCTNFGGWMSGQCLSYADELDEECRLAEALEFLAYPFGGSDQYDKECIKGTMHLNEERIAWVRAKLAQPVEV